MSGLQMQGVLFRYGNATSNVAFKSGQSNKHVILVGGLTDGLLSLSYSKPLSDKLELVGWSLVQAQLSSSYMGYGLVNLDKDVEEIQQLIQYLKQEEKSEQFILMGHSTGCQDSVRYVQTHGQSQVDEKQLKGVILQAPVSDREYMIQFEEYEELLPIARKAIEENRGDKVVFRPEEQDFNPITATRLLSFLERGGDDDMFSSDFSDQELKELLGHMQIVPSIVIVSGKEEYVPKSVDVLELGKQISSSMGNQSQFAIVEDGNHALEGKEDQLSEIVLSFISSIE